MKVIKKSLESLKIGYQYYNYPQATPAIPAYPLGMYNHSTILVQHNTKFKYVYINPNSIGNALFYIIWGKDDTDFIHVRGGSIVPLPFGRDIKVCLGAANFQRFGITPPLSPYFISPVSGANVSYDERMNVEFILLSADEAKTFLGNKLEVGDIIQSGLHSGAIYKPPDTYMFSAFESNTLSSLAWKGLSIRLRLSGGFVHDDSVPAWLHIANGYSRYKEITQVLSHEKVFGYENFPFPGIGEAYIQMPLVGFNVDGDNADDLESQSIVALSYPNGATNPFDLTAGLACIQYEIVAGHLPPLYRYWCERRIEENDFTHLWPFHFKISPKDTDATSFIVNNIAGGGGTWEITENIYHSDVETTLDVTKPVPDTHSIAAGAYLSGNVVENNAPVLSLVGKLTAPEVSVDDLYFCCYPKPVGA
jgi:hypothetical protein